MLFFRKNKRRSGEYLKYEEGDIVPVESNHPLYPPFINGSKKEDNSVKEFREMVKNNKNYNRNMDKGINNNQQNKNRRKSNWIFRLVWLAIISLLVYYSIPVFQYFFTETPKLVNQTNIGVDRSAVEEIDEGVNELGENAEEVISQVKDKKEQTEQAVKDSFSKTTDLRKQLIEKPDALSVESSDTLSQNEWIHIIASSQNIKQELIQKLRGLVAGLSGGDISHSRYRMELKGISTKVERQLLVIENYKNHSDSPELDRVLNVLSSEYNHLRDWVVELNSVDPSVVVLIFNDGLEKQNVLTEDYKSAFVGLLREFNYPYTIENGVIKIQ